MTIDIDTLDWMELESSNLDAIALSDGELFVRFKNGNLYCYADDASEEVESLHLAFVECASEGESVGSLFHELIRRPELPAVKIEPDSDN